MNITTTNKTRRRRTTTATTTTEGEGGEVSETKNPRQGTSEGQGQNLYKLVLQATLHKTRLASHVAEGRRILQHT